MYAHAGCALFSRGLSSACCVRVAVVAFVSTSIQLVGSPERG